MDGLGQMAVAYTHLRASADIVIERTDNSPDHRPSLSLTELWVFVGEATPLVLTQTSPQRWEAKDFIKL